MGGRRRKSPVSPTINTREQQAWIGGFKPNAVVSPRATGRTTEKLVEGVVEWLVLLLLLLLLL